MNNGTKQFNTILQNKKKQRKGYILASIIALICIVLILASYVIIAYLLTRNTSHQVDFPAVSITSQTENDQPYSTAETTASFTDLLSGDKIILSGQGTLSENAENSYIKVAFNITATNIDNSALTSDETTSDAYSSAMQALSNGLGNALIGESSSTNHWANGWVRLVNGVESDSSVYGDTAEYYLVKDADNALGVSAGTNIYDLSNIDFDITDATIGNVLKGKKINITLSVYSVVANGLTAIRNSDIDETYFSYGDAINSFSDSEDFNLIKALIVRDNFTATSQLSPDDLISNHLVFSINSNADGYKLIDVDDNTISSVSIPAYIVKVKSSYYAVDSDTYGALPVTQISQEAFMGCTNLASVIIPNTVIYMESNVFSGCTSLTTVTIPNSFTTFYITAEADGPFANSSISSIVFATGSQISNLTSYIFGNATALENVDFGGNTNLTSINSNAFYNCASLTSFEIPNTIIYLASGVFTNCNNLSTLSFEDDSQITSIPTGCFNSLTGLHSVNFGANSLLTAISPTAFASCSALTNIIIPNSVTSIGHDAFNYCTSLVEIDIPAGVNVLGESIFYGSGIETIHFADYSTLTELSSNIFDSVTSLREVTFGANSQLNIIKTNAFANCTGLISITIPKSLTTLESAIFANCTSLESIYFEDDSQLNSLPLDCFSGLDTLIAFRFGANSSITTINNGAFYGCSALVQIVIPRTVTSFGDAVFSQCTSLQSIIFEENSQLTSIAENTFSNLSALTTITFGSGSGLTSIETNAFGGCSSLISIILPKSLTEISAGVFNGCDLLNSITFEDDSQIASIPNGCFGGLNIKTFSFGANSSVTSIETYAFSSCSSLTSIVLPKSLTEIQGGVFSSCSALRSITFEDGSQITNIPTSCFAGLHIDTFSFGANSSVTSIDTGAFAGCSALTSIIIPNSVNSFAEQVFSGSSALRSITFEDDSQITSIPTNCFIGLNIETFSFGANSSVTSIGAGAFGGCSHLLSIIIPSSVTTISADTNMFGGCSSLSSIIFEDGSLLTVAPDSCFSGLVALSNFSFGANSHLTSLGIGVFGGCSLLQSIIIPSSVTTFVADTNNGPFSGAGFVDINFEDNSQLTEIPEKGFYGLNKLESVTWGQNSSLATINQYAFNNCSVLQSFTVPSSLTSIAAGIFGGCTSLQSIVFEDNSLLTTLPENCFNNSFTSLQTIIFGLNSSLTTIGASAFTGCSSLLNFIVPDTVTTIGSSAFASCTSLTSFTFPSSLTSLDTYILSDCSNLASINFANGCQLTTLNENSFTGLPKLTNINFGLYSHLTIIKTAAVTTCPLLTSITLPASLITLESAAFASNAISSITFEDNSQLLNIGSATFSPYAGTLTSVNFGTNSSLTTIQVSAFGGCSKITSLVIPSSVTEIAAGAFGGCIGLESIVFEDNSLITTLNYQVFAGLAGLTSIFFGENSILNRIGEEAFLGCSNLETIIFPNTLKSIGNKALDNTLWYTHQSDGLIYAGKTVYTYKGEITGSITLADDVLGIADYAFSSTELTSITLPIALEVIGVSAFADCTNLQGISIPSTVTSIGDLAFDGCTALTSVIINSPTITSGLTSLTACGSLIENASSINVPTGTTVPTYLTTNYTLYTMAGWDIYNKII